MRKNLLVDTNILLHYRPLDEIDWPREVGADEVEILIAPTLIRELEKHKASSPIKQVRKRAVDRVKWLHSQLSASPKRELRSGVTLRFIPHEPSIDFHDHQLDRDIADDWLIAHAIEESQDESSSLSIITADTGLHAKSLHRNLDVVFWDDNPYKLMDEEDSEQKQIRELQAKIRDYTNLMPKLRLQYEDGTQHRECFLKQRTERTWKRRCYR